MKPDFKAMLRQTVECLFCGKKREWRSKLKLFTKDYEICIITICPKCRKNHTVYELYEKVTEKMINEAKEYLELGETE